MERQRKGSEQRERNVEEIIEANRMSVVENTSTLAARNSLASIHRTLFFLRFETVTVSSCGIDGALHGWSSTALVTMQITALVSQGLRQSSPCRGGVIKDWQHEFCLPHPPPKKMICFPVEESI